MSRTDNAKQSKWINRITEAWSDVILLTYIPNMETISKSHILYGAISFLWNQNMDENV